MKPLHKLLAATALTLVLTSSAWAGVMGFPVAPSGGATTGGVMHTGVAPTGEATTQGEMQFPVAPPESSGSTVDAILSFLWGLF